MTTDPEMTIVTALIRPLMESRVVQALHDLPEFPGFVLTEARGQGRGRGAGGAYTSADSDFTYHHFIELRLVCGSHLVEEVCEKIAGAAWTGRKGDGVIFTTPVQSFVRIREAGMPKQESSHD